MQKQTVVQRMPGTDAALFRGMVKQDQTKVKGWSTGIFLGRSRRPSRPGNGIEGLIPGGPVADIRLRMIRWTDNVTSKRRHPLIVFVHVVMNVYRAGRPGGRASASGDGGRRFNSKPRRRRPDDGGIIRTSCSSRSDGKTDSDDGEKLPTFST